MPEDRAPDETGQIPTHLRLLMLLEEVARAGVPVTPSTVNEALQLPKPTVHRLFHKAEAEGFLQRDVDGKSYSPGARLRKLAVHTLSSERVRTIRLAVLRAVAERIGETCNLVLPEREGMIYLDRVETHWPLRIQLPVGTEVPFHCTASGKMYLSTLRPDSLERLLKHYELQPMTRHTIVDAEALKEELAQTRTRRYATDDEEFMDGMAAISVPVLDDHGRFLSALSVHAPILRHTVEGLKAHLAALQEAAQELSELATQD